MMKKEGEGGREGRKRRRRDIADGVVLREEKKG